MVADLWESYSRQLLFYLNKQIGDKETARDLLQDTFQKVLTQQKNIDQIKNHKAWIFSIARNTLIDYTRKKKEQPLDDLTLVGDDNGMTSEDITTCLAHCVYKLIEEYEGLEPEVLLNVFTRSWTQKEAAAHLNLPYSTLKSRIQKARKDIAQSVNANCNCNCN